MTNHRGMEFTCSQDWEQMRVIEGCRFCDSCSKPVIDFTAWRREDVVAHFKEQPDTCGRFRPDQVDPTLIPINEVGQGLKRGFLASLLALGLQQLPAQSKVDPPATEQTQRDSSSTVSRHYDPATLATRMRKAELGGNVHGENCTVPKAITTRKRKRHYVSWRFPFYHVRSYHVVGAGAF